MKVSKTKAQIIQDAIVKWESSGTLSQAESQRLMTSIEIEAFDWQRLAKYSMWTSVICILISVGAVLADKVLLELLQKWFNAPDIVKCLGIAGAAGGLYYWGAHRRRTKPHMNYSNEAIFLLGVLATAGSIFYFGKAIDTGSGHFSLLLLLSFVVYAALGIYLDSVLIWIFSILSFGSWFGTETGYSSGWGAYYLGMNYPLRFVLFGSLLLASCYAFLKNKRLEPFHRSTHILGMLYLFIALWILSIFGNYGDMHSWHAIKQIELFHWSLLFGLASGGAIYQGLKYDNGASRGFGISFLFINLYTRFFEYFWDSIHKAIFFSLLGVSLWIIGSRAEKIWHLGRAKDKS